jgi:predicted nucleic acid-binding protein
MKWLLVDTAGWMAMADASDPRHRECCSARDRWLESDGGLVTTDYIIDETLTVIRMRLSLSAAAKWWDQVEQSTRLRWEWIDIGRTDKARQWFFRWRDKDFSFTDCTSFVVMRELRLRKALTTDRHFEQAGFQIMPAR